MQRRHKLTKTLLVSALMGGVMPVIPASLPVIGVSQAEAAVASRIEVRGNTRIEASTVESYLTISRGRRYGPADVDESLKTLFATGLFEDVRISQQGGTLVVTVVENPMVNRISFEGNKRLSDKTLEGVVRTQERSMLTRAKVQSDVQNVLEAYRRLRPLSRDRRAEDHLPLEQSRRSGLRDQRGRSHGHRAHHLHWQQQVQ